MMLYNVCKASKCLEFRTLLLTVLYTVYSKQTFLTTCSSMLESIMPRVYLTGLVFTVLLLIKSALSSEIGNYIFEIAKFFLVCQKWPMLK